MDWIAGWHWWLVHQCFLSPQRLGKPLGNNLSQSLPIAGGVELLRFSSIRHETAFDQHAGTRVFAQDVRVTAINASRRYPMPLKYLVEFQSSPG